MSSILIEMAVLTVDDAGTIHEPGYVLIGDDDRGRGAVRQPDEVRRRRTRSSTPHAWRSCRAWSTHTHLFQTFLRGWPTTSRCSTGWRGDLAGGAGAEPGLRRRWGAGRISAAAPPPSSTTIHPHRPAQRRRRLPCGRGNGVRFLLARGWTDMGYHPAFMESPDRIMAEMRGCTPRGRAAPMAASAWSLRRSSPGVARRGRCSAPTHRARRGGVA